MVNSFLTMLHFLVVALAGHAKSAPQRRWKMGSESGESGFKQGHPAFLFFCALHDPAEIDLLGGHYAGKEISEGDAWRAADRCAAKRTVPSVRRFPRANDSTSLIV